jgi:nitrate reductase beta subunit
MPEIAGQIIEGRQMSERELFVHAIQNIKQLRDCYRGLALSRGDERWLVPARMMEELEDRTKRMMTARQSPFLILPRGA